MTYSILFYGNDVAMYERLQACTAQEIKHLHAGGACECEKSEVVLLLVELACAENIVNKERFSDCFSVVVTYHYEEKQNALIDRFNDVLVLDKPENMLRMRFNLYNNTILAESALRYNRDKYKDFFYQNDLPVVLLDQKGIVMEVNKKFLQISEYNESDLYYKPYTNIFQDFDLEQSKENGIAIANLITKRNEQVTKELQISKILVSNEDVFLVVCHEMNEQISYVQKIQYDEIRFRSVIEKSPNGLIIFKDGIITFINDSALATLGGEEKNYEQQEILQLVVPNQKDAFEKFIEKQTQNSTNETKRFTFLSINREEIFVKVYCKSLSFGGEHLISFQDISELVKSKELLAHQELYLNEIQTMAKIGHYEADLKTNTVYWSRELYNIYEVDPQTFTPSLRKMWQHVVPSDLPAVEKCYAIAKKRQGVHEVTFRLNIDGEEKWIYERFYSVFGDNGKIQQVVGWIHDITETIVTKEALAFTKNKYTSIFYNLSIAVVTTSIEISANGQNRYTIQEMNPAFAKLTGVEEEVLNSFVGLDLGEGLLEPGFWQQHCDEAYYQDKSLHFEYYEKHLQKHLKVTLFTTKDKLQLLAVIEDVSDSITTKQALVLTENKYTQLFENLSIGFLACSIEKDENNQPVDYIIRELNPACEQIWKGNGIEFKTILNKSVREAIVTSEFWIQACNQVYHENRTIQFKHHAKNFNKILKATIFMTPDKTHMLAFVEDVSEQEIAEQITKNLNNRLQKIQKYARIGTLTIYANGDYVWNNVMYQLFEYNTNMKPSIELFMSRVHPEEKEFVLDSFYNTIKKKERFFLCEMRLQFADGRIKHLYSEIEHFYKNGEWERTEGWMQDITNRREIELQLIYAKEKAEESDRLKSSFLANMSHEIRTPLNAIVGFSNLLARKNYPEEKRKLFLNDIQNNSKQLLTIINDILDISKIESEQLELSYIWIDLNRLMQEVNDTMQFQVKGKDVSLFCQKPLPDSQAHIYMDDVRLKQILTNLISNAIKFTEHGFVNFGYTLKNNKTLEFFVKDTGVGIAPEKQKTIFEHFRQEDETTSRKFGGSGLGLAISKRLVEIMGGRIWLESEKEKGAQFFFEVPYIQKQKEAISKIGTPLTDENSEDAFATMFNGEKILVIDDHESSYVLITEFLADYNVSVDYFGSGREAIAYVEKNPSVSLIFMDIHMPDLNGVETMKIIKANHPKIPIIAQTAFALKEDKRKYLSAGFDDYLPKPLNNYELMRILNRFFNRIE
ncbi:MAG: ATP-binding protein [Bacteroidetes bacterium]|nr:ATP-binding protein [Bacteroidota bacterium]